MMKLNNYLESHGERIVNMFVLIDPKTEIREDTVFVMKAKLHIQNALLKRNLFD